MKTVRFHETGGPDVLRFEDIDEPTPGPGQLKIRVEAVGVNFSDVLRRRGDEYPETSPTPFTPGSEVAGVVAELGDGVDGFKVGQSVYATPRVGGYAQYVVVDARTAVALPPGVSAAQATALPARSISSATGSGAAASTAAISATERIGLIDPRRRRSRSCRYGSGRPATR